MPAVFDTFFRAATGHAPYGYQRRLARAAAAELAGAASMEGPAPSGPFPCQSRLISIPAGLGKTVAVVMAWLWNFLHTAQKKLLFGEGDRIVVALRDRLGLFRLALLETLLRAAAARASQP